MPESFISNCSCVPAPGTVAPGIAPYVISIFGIDGIVTFGNTGAIEWTSLGNTIYANLSASAGLGSVTSVALASNNSNLSIVSGSPITTLGTITLGLAGNLGSISGLTMAADQMLYSTGAATFAATSLTAFGRSLIDDAAAVNARSTLGLVIGTDVQAFSQDLSDFVTNATWAGANLTLAGSLTLGLDLTLTVGDASFGNDVQITGGLTGNTGSFTGAVTALNFTGIGTGLTALNASNLTSGTTAVARGGTNISSYTQGDILYASAAGVLSKLASVSAGSYLRSQGVGGDPAWSTLKLLNAVTQGDILIGGSTNNVISLLDVATGNVLLSGGVATAPTYGKVTTAHTTGIAASGVNADITSTTSLTQITTSQLSVVGSMSVSGGLIDGGDSAGVSGDVLVSNGAGFNWTSQVTLATLTLTSFLNVPKTVTAAGVTGNQTINKPSGTVNFAAAGTSLLVTNSLVTANSIIIATVGSNDTTMKSVQAVAASGSFTLYPNAAPTAETRVNFLLTN